MKSTCRAVTKELVRKAEPQVLCSAATFSDERFHVPYVYRKREKNLDLGSDYHVSGIVAED